MLAQFMKNGTGTDQTPQTGSKAQPSSEIITSGSHKLYATGM
jgi:hypothetical protein